MLPWVTPGGMCWLCESSDFLFSECGALDVSDDNSGSVYSCCSNDVLGVVSGVMEANDSVAAENRRRA